MTTQTMVCRSGYLKEQMVTQRRDDLPFASLWKTLLPPLLLFGALVIQISVRLAVIETGYEFERLRLAALERDSLLRERKLEYAFVARPDVLTQRAMDELRMVALRPSALRPMDERLEDVYAGN